MKVEVLYVAGCPSHPAAVQLVRDALMAEGIVADVHEVLVSNDRKANELKFFGSPTIRINGQDVDEASRVPRNFGLSCRLYRDSKQIGLPSSELVQKAIVQAQLRRKS